MNPTLVSIGLALDLVGIAILFRWGPPLPSFEGGIAPGLEAGTPLGDGRTVADEERDQKSRRKRHMLMSRIALGLIAVGFAMQLVAQWT